MAAAAPPLFTADQTAAIAGIAPQLVELRNRIVTRTDVDVQFRARVSQKITEMRQLGTQIRTKMNEFRGASAPLLQRITELEQQLAACNQARQQLEAGHAEDERRLVELNNTVRELQEQIRNNVGNTDALTRERDALIAERNQLQQTIAGYNGEKETVVAQITDTTTALNNTNAVYQALEAGNDATIQQLER